MSSSWFRLPTDFYRATSAVLGIVIRSVRLFVRPYVCHTRALWLIKRTYRRYFYTTRNGDHVIHLNVGGHNHKLRLSSSVIGGEMSCRRNVHVVGEVSSYRYTCCTCLPSFQFLGLLSTSTVLLAKGAPLNNYAAKIEHQMKILRTWGQQKHVTNWTGNVIANKNLGHQTYGHFGPTHFGPLQCDDGQRNSLRSVLRGGKHRPTIYGRVALCNRADHYIFALWFLSIFYLLLSFLFLA